MSGFEATLELERPNRTYRPGEPIAGRVRLRVFQELTACEVRLSLHWRTSGKGDVEQGEPDALDLALDERLDVGERAFAFSLTAPDGPPTFHGKLIHVDWVLQAFVRADRGAADLEEDLVLVAARTTVLDGKPRGKARSRALVPVPDHATVAQAAYMGLLAAVGLGIGASWGGNWVCACGLPGFVMAITALAMVPRALASKRLGPLTLEVQEELAPGETLRVALGFRPPDLVSLNAITVTLRADESATSGSGSGSTTVKHVAFLKTASLSGATTVDPRGFEGEVELKLPADAPASFATAKNSIRWTLQVEVDIPWWPDWRVELPIVVLPGASTVVATVRRSIAIQPLQRCPFCRDTIASAEPAPVVSCGGCNTVLHDACWAELGRCPTRGCGRERPRMRVR